MQFASQGRGGEAGLAAAHSVAPMLLKYSATAARVCALEEEPLLVHFIGVCPMLFAAVRSKGGACAGS